MPANIGDGVKRTRGANGKLVTARRSVARSGQHSELLEQPEEIVAVQFPGKLAASLPRPAAPRPAQRPQRRHTALTWEDAADEYTALVTSWWTGGYTATVPAAARDVGLTAMGEADQGG
jgi:hypothetical protein